MCVEAQRSLTEPTSEGSHGGFPGGGQLLSDVVNVERVLDMKTNSRS